MMHGGIIQHQYTRSTRHELSAKLIDRAGHKLAVDVARGKAGPALIVRTKDAEDIDLAITLREDADRFTCGLPAVRQTKGSSKTLIRRHSTNQADGSRTTAATGASLLRLQRRGAAPDAL